MRIVVRNIECKVVGAKKRARDELDEILSFKVPGAEYSKAY